MSKCTTPSQATSTQTGFALVTALLFLIILSVLAVSMFGSSGIQGKISGNTLEHHRAMQAAEYALNYGEWLLKQGGMPSQTCNQMVDLNVPGNRPMICTNPLINPTTVPWTSGMTLTPTGMTVQAGGGMASAPGAAGVGNTGVGDVNYARQPSLYIYLFGTDPGGAPLYQLSAAGFGGNSSSVSVLQVVVSLGN